MGEDFNDTYAGRSEETIREVLEGATKYMNRATRSLPCLTVADWLTRELPEPDRLCGAWLTTTTRALVTAPTGIGKTNFALALAGAVAAGADFLHWHTHRAARVLFVDGEMSRRQMKARLDDAVRRMGVSPDGLRVLSHEDVENFAPLNTPEGQSYVDNLIADLGEVDLVVFDNIMSLLTGDMKEEEHWAQTMPWIRSLTQRGIGQLWVHHTGHNQTRGYGSSTREWQLDTVLHLEAVKRGDTDVSFDLIFRKARERNPATRGDFADARVALLNDQWTSSVKVPASQGKTSPKAGKFFDALNAALVSSGEETSNGRRSTTMAAWCRVCEQHGLVDKEARPNSARSLFSKYRRELEKTGLIACEGDRVWSV